MKTRMKVFQTWVLVVALIGGAFLAGARLRARQNTSISSNGVSVQANMLLKLTPESSPVTADNIGQSTNENRELVSSVLKLLKLHYVEPITPERETLMARGAVRGMLDSLSDPDSHFVDPTERKLLDDAASGRFHGIGAILALRNEKVGELDTVKIIVVAPMPGSSAEAAGLKPGDSITDIGGKWIVTHDPFQEANLAKMAKAVRNKEINEITYQKAFEAADKKLREGIGISNALETLTAKSSGETVIRAERAGQTKPMEFKLQCRNTEVDPVASRTLKRGIAYIRISEFNRRAVKEFTAELEHAKANRARALVLDLRSNPGGTIEAATEITSRITGGRIVGTVQEKSRRHTIRAPKTRGLNLPVVVLVNGGTASVAELVAGTLRDTGAATIVGTRTFGDGLVQTPLLLKDGSAAVLTTGKMLTAKGYDFDARGLEPDKQVEQEHRSGDDQLDEAAKILAAKLGRA